LTNFLYFVGNIEPIILYFLVQAQRHWLAFKKRLLQWSLQSKQHMPDLLTYAFSCFLHKKLGDTRVVLREKGHFYGS